MWTNVHETTNHKKVYLRCKNLQENKMEYFDVSNFINKRSWLWKNFFLKESFCEHEQKLFAKTWTIVHEFMNHEGIHSIKTKMYHEVEQICLWFTISWTFVHGFVNGFPKYSQRMCTTLSHPKEHLFWGVSLRWKMLTMRADPSTAPSLWKVNSFAPAGSNYGVFMDVKNPANGFESSWGEGKCTNLAALQTAAAAAAGGKLLI